MNMLSVRYIKDAHGDELGISAWDDGTIIIHTSGGEGVTIPKEDILLLAEDLKHMSAQIYAAERKELLNNEVLRHPMSVFLQRRH